MRPTTTAVIASWLAEAKAADATHLIIAGDNRRDEDYPVAVLTGQSVVDEVRRLEAGARHKVSEVYDLALPWDVQLNEQRAYHI